MIERGLAEKNQRNSEKKLKLSHEGLNRGLRCEKPESNRLSYGTAILYHLGTEMFIVVDNEILACPLRVVETESR
jgi:hypothetical protein